MKIKLIELKKKKLHEEINKNKVKILFSHFYIKLIILQYEKCNVLFHH